MTTSTLEPTTHDDATWLRITGAGIGIATVGLLILGATLMFSRQSLLQGNQVAANRRHGILFKQVDQSRIIGNIICGHNRGLFIQQATQNRFEKNVIAKNDIGVYLSNCSEQNVFVRNSFIGNTDQVWQPADEVERGRLASNAFSQERQGNFWSDYTGTDQNHVCSRLLVTHVYRPYTLRLAARIEALLLRRHSQAGARPSRAELIKSLCS